VNIRALVTFHREQGTLATVTAVQPPGRFGALDLDRHRITGFREKPDGDGGWINGGYFVLSPRVLDYIAGDATSWERDPLERLASEGQLSAYRHYGFWHPMDTLRDKILLDGLWNNGKAPWRVWD
jgi:glucose-1-phosphate cytidylyltransferase